jgi:hypothetical protein
MKRVTRHVSMLAACIRDHARASPEFLARHQTIGCPRVPGVISHSSSGVGIIGNLLQDTLLADYV